MPSCVRLRRSWIKSRVRVVRHEELVALKLWNVDLTLTGSFWQRQNLNICQPQARNDGLCVNRCITGPKSFCAATGLGCQQGKLFKPASQLACHGCCRIDNG